MVASFIIFLVLFFIKGPKYQGKRHVVLSPLAIVALLVVGIPITTQAAQSSNIIASYFANIAQGYSCLLYTSKGLSSWQKAEALISVAHPDFRDELIAEAEKMHIWSCLLYTSVRLTFWIRHWQNVPMNLKM